MQTLEVIGPHDADRDTFQTAAYNGIAGDVEYSTATVDDNGIWSFHAGAGRARAQSTLHIDQDGKHMWGRWWRTEDDGNTWTPWMRLTLARQ